MKILVKINYSNLLFQIQGGINTFLLLTIFYFNIQRRSITNTTKTINSNCYKNKAGKFNSVEFVKPKLTKEEVLEIKDDFLLILYRQLNTKSICLTDLKIAITSLRFEAENPIYLLNYMRFGYSWNCSNRFSLIFKLMRERIGERDYRAFIQVSICQQILLERCFIITLKDLKQVTKNYEKQRMIPYYKKRLKCQL